MGLLLNLLLYILSFSTILIVSASFTTSYNLFDIPCPSCANNGICNTTTGECQCTNNRFRNAPSRGRFNCTALSCEEGDVIEELNTCICNEGWQGPGCVQCTSDEACQRQFRRLHPDQVNGTSICDRGFFPAIRRHYYCNILQAEFITLLGPYTTMTCSQLVRGIYNGTCSFQAWTINSRNFPRNYMAQSVDCVFSECSRIVNIDGTVEAQCLKSDCKCGEADKCDDPNVRHVVETMKGHAKVICNVESRLCDVQQQEFPGTIKLLCDPSECVNVLTGYDAPDMLYVNLSIGLASALGAIVTFILFVVCVNDLIFNARVSREWKLKLSRETLGASFEFININFNLKVNEGGKWKIKTIINNISHKINAGTMLAIMGPSGAGKTTLLDILAKRSKEGYLSGKILVNGVDLGFSFQRITGYVFQDDILMSTMTVKESLMFSANMRLPRCVSHAMKEERVKQVMEDLGISHIENRMIGNEMTRGISGGEKRRVSIGMELVVSPSVLFLDEPTSGLDSWSAYTVMMTLKKLAEKGRTIIFSIHQPRSNIFAQFDEVLLMHKGNIAYSGPSLGAVDYFTSLGYAFPANTNPADYLIDILTMLPPRFTGKPSFHQSSSATLPNSDIGEISNNIDVKDMTKLNEVGDEVSLLKNVSSSSAAAFYDNDDITSGHIIPYATSFLDQFYYLSRRAFSNFIRNFFLMPAHYGSAIILGLVLGGLYWKLGINLQACQNRVGVLFFICTVLAFGAMSSLELFISERVIYIRERANGYYRPMAYFFSKTLFDILPLRIVPPLLMGSIAYFMIGLRSSPMSFFYFLIIIVLFNIVAGALCLIIAAIAPSVAAANVIAIGCILVATLFAGFLVNRDSLPPWLSWVFYSSFFAYAFEALLINELTRMPIIIDAQGVKPYPGTGDFILRLFGMDVDRFYLDIVVLFCFGFTFIVIAGFLIKYFVKEKR